MTYTIAHGALSNPGRKRPHNENRYGIDTDLGLFVVCDGMGEGKAGEVAGVAVKTTGSGSRYVNGWPFSRLFGGSNASTDRGRHPSRQAA